MVKKLIENFKNLPIKTRSLMGVGLVFALFVALPLFLYAVLNGNFELRRKAISGEPTPSPVATVTPAPNCNAVCTQNAECIGGAICFNGLCSHPICDATPSGSPTPTPTPTPLPTDLPPTPSGSPIVTPACNEADINKDGVVDITDYSFLVVDFFNTDQNSSRSDINNDGIVDITDYSLLVANFFESTGACQ